MYTGRSASRDMMATGKASKPQRWAPSWFSDDDGGMHESDDGAATYYRGYVGPSDGSGSESQAQAARARKLYRSVIRVSDGEKALDAVIRGGSGIRVIGSGAEGGSTKAELAWIRQLEENDLSGVAPYSTNDVALILLEGDVFTVYAARSVKDVQRHPQECGWISTPAARERVGRAGSRRRREVACARQD